MKKRLAVSLLLLVGLCLTSIAQTQPKDNATICPVGNWNVPVIYRFEPSDSLTIVVGRDTVYHKGKLANRNLAEINLSAYRQYADEFQRRKESSVYRVAQDFDIDLGESWKNNIIAKIEEILERKPNFEGFLKWLDEKNNQNGSPKMDIKR